MQFKQLNGQQTLMPLTFTQLKPFSTVQLDEHPSLFSVFPSSHPYEASNLPLPHIATVVLVVFVWLEVVLVGKYNTRKFIISEFIRGLNEFAVI
jgi:hypothetical protein